MDSESMQDNVTTIKDSARFGEICKKYFNKNHVFIKLKTGNPAVKYIDYMNGMIELEIADCQITSEYNVFLANTPDGTVYVHGALHAKDEMGRYLFKVKKSR